MFNTRLLKPNPSFTSHPEIKDVKFNKKFKIDAEKKFLIQYIGIKLKNNIKKIAEIKFEDGTIVEFLIVGDLVVSDNENVVINTQKNLYFPQTIKKITQIKTKILIGKLKIKSSPEILIKVNDEIIHEKCFKLSKKLDLLHRKRTYKKLALEAKDQYEENQEYYIAI
ncbi:hypothetical protein [Phosphitispora sp. TUW77]|uniref:hypothetical protein n=1 Tax=Phosphitispora sp. TUW77 TaxID=3152361 RepID=UPI003AB5C244